MDIDNAGNTKSAAPVLNSTQWESFQNSSIFRILKNYFYYFFLVTLIQTPNSPVDQCMYHCVSMTMSQTLGKTFFIKRECDL